MDLIDEVNFWNEFMWKYHKVRPETISSKNLNEYFDNILKSLKDN